jgi:hypothetical protein
MKDTTGLLPFQWPGTWLASGNSPIVLDSDIRGTLQSIAGGSTEKLTSLSGTRLSEGMLVYVKESYTASEPGATPSDPQVQYAREGGQYYQYRAGGATRDANGAFPNNSESYWHVLGLAGDKGDPGVSSSIYKYKAETTATFDADDATKIPGAAQIMWSSAGPNQKSAEYIYVSHKTSDTLDIDNFLSLLQATQPILIQNATNSESYQKFTITGAPTRVVKPNGASSIVYWSIPVEETSSSGLAATAGFSDEDDILLVVVSGARGEQGPQGESATIVGKTRNTLFTTELVDANDPTQGVKKEYGPLTGWTANDHEAFIVKLGGVILTGGTDKTGANAKGYVIEGTTQQSSKVVLTEEPSVGYELEVRAISVGAAATTLSGTLSSPIREVAKTDINVIPAETRLDLGLQQVYLYPGDAPALFSLNLKHTESNNLNALMQIGEAIGATVMVGAGTTGTLPALGNVQIDGVTQAVKWVNSTKTLTAGKLNIISLTVIKTANDAFTVVGSVVAAGTPA